MRFSINHVRISLKGHNKQILKDFRLRGEKERDRKKGRGSREEKEGFPKAKFVWYVPTTWYMVVHLDLDLGACYSRPQRRK